MQMKSRLLALCFLLLATTSCITMAIATVATSAIYELATRNTSLKGETVMKINDKAALLETRKGETVCIVYLFSDYKDGQKINAKFRRGGIFEYRDENGTTRRVPIYVESKHVSELVQAAIDLDVRYQSETQAPVYQI